MNDLFPIDFLTGISRLSLRLRLAPPRALAGVHLSRAVGASLQFRDYQMYTPGDDLRRVDWNVYARTRHLFVRRFDRPTAVPIFMIVDASRSMLLEERPAAATRYTTAARVAAAVAMAAIASQNPVYLSVADGKSTTAPRVLTGRRGFVRALADLSLDREGGGQALSHAIASLGPLLAARGPGVLVVVSDFFDDGGVNAIIDAMRLIPGRLLLLQIVQPWDQSPNLIEDLELADCETGVAMHVSPNARMLAHYRQAYSDYFGQLRSYTDARGSTLATFDAASNSLNQLQQLFPGGTLTL